MDAVFDNFQIFNLAGQLLLNLGETGNGPGEFGLPNGIAIGADNQIYVADALQSSRASFQIPWPAMKTTMKNNSNPI